MKATTIILIAWICILLLLCAGCTTSIIKEVDDACRNGNIEEFKERNKDLELTFQCYEKESFL